MAGKAGQIIPRGERTWLVRVFMGRDSESGKRKYINKTIHGTLRDAQAYLSRSQRDRDLGVFFEPSKMSLDGYLDKWLETAAKPKLRAKTHRDYQALLSATAKITNLLVSDINYYRVLGRQLQLKHLIAFEGWNH